MICPKCNREIQFYYLDVELYCPLCLCSLRGNSPEVIRVKQAKLYLRPKNYVPDEHIISHILDPIKASKQRYDQEKRVRPESEVMIEQLNLFCLQEIIEREQKRAEHRKYRHRATVINEPDLFIQV